MRPLENNKDWYTYSNLIDSMEVSVLVEVDEADYQGSSWLIVRDGDRYGYLSYGWGSCSGCDALEACESAQEATELRDELWNGIHWEDSAAELLTYFVDTDWELKWEYHDQEFQAFLAEAKNVLYNAEMAEIGL